MDSRDLDAQILQFTFCALQAGTVGDDDDVETILREDFRKVESNAA